MKKVKIGDVLVVNGEEMTFVGYDRFTYYGTRCVLLATDPNNKNTYARYSQQYLNERGYSFYRR